MRLSIVLITYNEEANIGRTLASVRPLVDGGNGEIVVVDSGSTDRTVEIAQSYGAKVYDEPWKGYSAQKNSAIAKATGDWVLSLDADEELDPKLAALLAGSPSEGLGPEEWCLTLARARWPNKRNHLPGLPAGFFIPRKNFFLGRWMKHGGFWPDPKLRLFRREAGVFEDRLVHEDVKLAGPTLTLPYPLVHHCYPTLSDYIQHMDRYSSLGAKMIGKGAGRFRLGDIVLRPLLTFIYNFFVRLGFLDGREGLLLHLYHAVYVSWKYAKAWELKKAGPR